MITAITMAAFTFAFRDVDAEDAGVFGFLLFFCLPLVIAFFQDVALLKLIESLASV